MTLSPGLRGWRLAAVECYRRRQ